MGAWLSSNSVRWTAAGDAYGNRFIAIVTGVGVGCGDGVADDVTFLLGFGDKRRGAHFCSTVNVLQERTR